MWYRIKAIGLKSNILEETNHPDFHSEIELKELPTELIRNAKKLIKRTKRERMSVVTNERGEIVWIGSYNENFIESMKGEQK